MTHPLTHPLLFKLRERKCACERRIADLTARIRDLEIQMAGALGAFSAAEDALDDAHRLLKGQESVE